MTGIRLEAVTLATLHGLVEGPFDTARLQQMSFNGNSIWKSSDGANVRQFDPILCCPALIRLERTSTSPPSP